jgi:hypothetical protein
MSNTEVLMYVTLAVVGFIFFFTYIYPRFFNKPKGPQVDAPNWRGKAQLIDNSIKGGIAEIQSMTNFGNGMVKLRLHNKNGFFEKDYVIHEIVPLNNAQVLADEGPPVYMTKASKYGLGEYRAEIESSRSREYAAIQDADYWKREHSALKANLSNEVNERIKQATELKKTGSSQAFGDRPREYTP